MSHGAAAGPSACRAVLARAISVIFLPRVRNHAAIGRLVRRSKPSARYQPRTLELPTNCKPVRPPGIRCASSLVIVRRVACATPCGGLGFADFDGVPDPGADEPPADDGPLFFETGGVGVPVDAPLCAAGVLPGTVRSPGVAGSAAAFP